MGINTTLKFRNCINLKIDIEPIPIPIPESNQSNRIFIRVFDVVLWTIFKWQINFIGRIIQNIYNFFNFYEFWRKSLAKNQKIKTSKLYFSKRLPPVHIEIISIDRTFPNYSLLWWIYFILLKIRFLNPSNLYTKHITILRFLNFYFVSNSPIDLFYNKESFVQFEFLFLQFVMCKLLK